MQNNFSVQYYCTTVVIREFRCYRATLPEYFIYEKFRKKKNVNIVLIHFLLFLSDEPLHKKLQ